MHHLCGVAVISDHVYTVTRLKTNKLQNMQRWICIVSLRHVPSSLRPARRAHRLVPDLPFTGWGSFFPIVHRRRCVTNPTKAKRLSIIYILFIYIYIRQYLQSISLVLIWCRHFSRFGTPVFRFVPMLFRKVKIQTKFSEYDSILKSKCDRKFNIIWNIFPRIFHEIFFLKVSLMYIFRIVIVTIRFV